jgi:hypothetical protein
MAHTTAGASAPADAAVAAVGLRKVYGGVIDRPQRRPHGDPAKPGITCDATACVRR